MGLGLQTSKVLDRGAVELLGPYGLSQSLYGSSQQLASADTGIISSYGLYLVIGAISLTLLLFAPMLAGTDSALASLSDVRVVLLYAAAIFYLVLT